MTNDKSVEITSHTNRRYRELISLHGSRGIRRTGYALVPGTRFVKSFLEHAPDQCRAMILRSGDQLLIEHSGLERIVLTPSLFRALDRWGCGPPILKIAVPPFPEWHENVWPEGCTLVLPLQDPKNMGAALRCAAAFGVQNVVITRESAHPYHPDAIRASAAVLTHLKIYSVSESFVSNPWPAPFFALHTSGTRLASFYWPRAFGLVLGMEGPGIPCDMDISEYISIPMEPGIESLNATAALAIVLYQWHMHATVWGDIR